MNHAFSHLQGHISGAFRPRLLPSAGQPGGAAFSPLSLFAAGELGGWYDPSDLTTMFQDAAGTVPVTADSDPVRLILDKSQGLTLGSELVTNGTFDADIAGWSTVPTATNAWDAGRLLSNATANFSGTSRLITVTAGESYRIELDFERGTSANVRALVSATYQQTSSAASGKISFIAVATSATMTLRIDSGPGTGTFWIDNVSVRALAGSHATAPSDAARPLYKTSGGLHWLEFDGIDDYLVTSAINFSAGTTMTMATATTKKVSGSQYTLSIGTATSNRALLAAQASAGSAPFRTAAYTHNLTDAIATPENDATPKSDVIVGRGRIVVPYETSVYRNNDTVVTSTANQSATFPNSPIYIGCIYTVASFLKGNMYGAIVRAAYSSDDEIDAIQDYLAAKIGGMPT